MRSNLILAINELCSDRKLPAEVVMEAVHAALVSAYKRNFGGTGDVEVRIEPATGDVRVFASKEVVVAPEDPKSQVSLAEAQRLDPSAQIGQTIQVESTPRDFGRIAAQTAKQVILQRIREAERDQLYSSFAESAGEIKYGTIQSVDFHSGDVIVNVEGAEAVLPQKEQVPSEKYRRGMRLRSYVLEVRRGSRGPQITLTRKSPAFLRRLMESEVPEISNGSVEIKSIAREAGSRSKVAVFATQEGVDPVGSCVGVRGGRIQNVVTELGGEKIDVVQWNSDLATYIANALSPAKVMNVLLDENPEVGKTATVIVPDRQLSLAIGKEGQNARLAAKLTGWRIDIKSATEAAEETLGRLKDRVIAPEDMDLLTLAEVILQKHETTGFSQEELKQVAIEMEQGREAGVPWPEEAHEAGPVEAKKPAAAVPPPAEVERQVEPVAVAEAPAEAAPVAEVKTPAEAAEAELEVEEEEGPEAVAPKPFNLEEETQPPFEGEQVEESLGWVQTQPETDPYAGWQDEIEEVGEFEDEWVREELEEPEEAVQGGKKRKKKSGKSRFARKGQQERW